MIATDDELEMAAGEGKAPDSGLEVPLSRLMDAVKESRRKLTPWREQYIQLWKEYVGDFYGERANEKANPVNKMEQATTIYLQQLAGNPPRVNVFTRNRRYRAGATKLGLVMNSSLEDYRIHRALQRSVRNSLFGMGIVKVGLKSNGVKSIGGENVTTSTPFVESILLDDFVVDMTASSFDTAEYMGHKYRVSMKDAIRNPEWDKRVRAKLREQDNLNVDEDGNARLSEMSGEADRGKLYKQVEVWEVYVRSERKVVTYCEHYAGYPLRVVDWEGPERGPYHALFYNEVDGNVMPLAPAATWIHLHNFINSAMRKLIRQAERAKSVGLAPNMSNQNGGKDASTIMSASDGDVVAVESPEAIQERNFGGIDQSTFGFMLQCNQMFSTLAGNLETLGGLSAQTDTATQDAILNQNSSERINAMRQKVALFTKGVLTDLAFWMWTDPTETYRAEIDSPVGPLEVQLTPEERQYDFFENEIEIEPYSMVFQTPQQRSQQLSQLMMTTLLPAQPILDAQGLSLDFTQYIKMLAQYMNLPELNDLVKSQGMSLNANESAKPSERTTPPVKVSTENRVSKGAGGMQGDESSMIQRLMASGRENRGG